ncbi:MAG: efflux RND transporter periplasmic adaptor subunit, partial [Acidobacteriota bacterium]
MVEENKSIPEDEPAEKSSFNSKPIVIAAIVIAALVLGVLFLYLRSRPAVDADDEAQKKEEPVVSVKVAKAEKDTISSEISAPASVAPSEQSTVASTISAQIIQMRLLKNEVVQKGEVLAVLASQDLRAQRDEAQAALNEAKLNLETLEKVTIPQTSAQTEKDLSDAKANLDNVRATYERRKVLYQKGGISLKELEASELAVTNADNAYKLVQKNAGLNRSAVNPNSRSIAEARIKQAQDKLKAIEVQANMAEIKAPITGVVTDQFQFEGEFASSGAKLFTIADLSQVIVKAQLADTVVASLKTGDAVSVYTTGAPDERLTGRITLISRSGDTQSRTVEVWARFGNPRGLLIAGGAVQFVVTRETVDDAIVIPLAAVTLSASNADEGMVMTVGDDSVAH